MRPVGYFVLAMHTACLPSYLRHWTGGSTKNTRGRGRKRTKRDDDSVGELRPCLEPNFFQKSLSYQKESYYFIVLNKICL